MAEAMIDPRYRESIQSLDKMVDSRETHSESCDPDHDARFAKDGAGFSGNISKRVTHDPRTVVIEIPENKRRKVFTPMTGKHVIESIFNAVSYDERREAICTATTAFEHNMQSLHDEEIELGADAALIKHIGFILGHKGAEATLPYELSCTCEALEMIYRASPAAVSSSFHKYGVDTLSILIHLINDEISRRCNHKEQSMEVAMCKVEDMQQDTGSDDESANFAMTQSTTHCGSVATTQSISDEGGRRDGDIVLRKATKVMGHFARVGAATQPMAYYPGLLASLINVLMTQPYSLIPAEARLNSLWILANLACNTENMVMMACQPNLLTILVRLASRRVHHDDSVEIGVEVIHTQSIATRALVNLSWAPENRIPMSENQALIQVLCLLAVFRESPFKKGRTVSDMMLQSRRHSIGALRNMAAAPRRIKLELVHFQNGMVLEILTDAALNDPDGQVKERAFDTIHNLAIHDTAERMVQNPALVLALKDAMILSESEANKTFAQKTLLVLERSISEDMASYDTLRGLLDEVNDPNEDEKDVECCTPMSGLSDDSDRDENPTITL